MTKAKILDCLERAPVIAAVQENAWEQALAAPVEVLFYLHANVNTIRERIEQAHAAGKHLFVHIDLADGIAKDRAGIEYLARAGVDGIITTRSQTIHLAKEEGLQTVQRCFALDSQGTVSISEVLRTAPPDMLEIMPGVVNKLIERFASGSIPVIAGGLIETKAEATAALRSGAIAVSTGKQELWYS